jgi:hypothetical protein
VGARRAAVILQGVKIRILRRDVARHVTINGATTQALNQIVPIAGERAGAVGVPVAAAVVLVVAEDAVPGDNLARKGANVNSASIAIAVTIGIGSVVGYCSVVQIRHIITVDAAPMQGGAVAADGAVH